MTSQVCSAFRNAINTSVELSIVIPMVEYVSSRMYLPVRINIAICRNSESTGVRIIGPVGILEVQMTTFLWNKIFVKNEF